MSFGLGCATKTIINNLLSHLFLKHPSQRFCASGKAERHNRHSIFSVQHCTCTIVFHILQTIQLSCTCSVVMIMVVHVHAHVQYSHGTSGRTCEWHVCSVRQIYMCLRRCCCCCSRSLPLKRLILSIGSWRLMRVQQKAAV